MTLYLEYFPNDWIPELEKAMVKVKGALIIETVSTSEKLGTLLINIDSYTDLYLVGFWAGFNSAEAAFDEALPEVAENLSQYIDKITNPSTN